MIMTNFITLENLEDNKTKIRNSVSTFGNLNNPENWYKGLHLFVFENDSVMDAVTSFLLEDYSKQLKKIKL